MAMGPPYTRAVGLALVVGVPLVLVLALVVGLPWIVAWIVAWSVVTFAFYGLDKSAARGGRLRTPELVLHGLALAGGFAGGWAGRAVFRHKTRHPAFLIVLVLSTLAWGAALAWWFLMRA
jgi:uncharacterized membrane protein YsdA (DUF1294 family)